VAAKVQGLWDEGNGALERNLGGFSWVVTNFNLLAGSDFPDYFSTGYSVIYAYLQLMLHTLWSS